MPGSPAILRDDPTSVLDFLEGEGQENMPLLREIVGRVFDIGPSLIGDANKTRGLAIHAVDSNGRKTPQFFAIRTNRHMGYGPSRLRRTSRLQYSSRVPEGCRH